MPEYRKRIGERFAKKSHLKKVDIWIHAVSLGEVIAVSPLVDCLLEQGYQLMVTSTTPTGSKKLVDIFHNRIQHQYLPYDLPRLQKKFIQQIEPKLIVLMETEIWPNLIKQAKKEGIKVAIINARLSERSMRGYHKIGSLIAPVLQEMDAILTQSEADAHRFRQLAKHSNKPQIDVVGNIKFDQPLRVDQDKQDLLAIKERWGEQRPVLILASTHEDEEMQVLSHLQMIKKTTPDLLILVAPRHPERFQSVFEQSKKLGLVTYRRTQANQIKCDAEVIIIDCIGELMDWYALANVAFVGGSLVPIGGHNVLEPVQAGIPVVTGPHMHNFVQIAKLLVEAEAMISARDISELISVIIDLLDNQSKCRHMTAAAIRVLSENQGALKRYQDWIERSISELMSELVV